MSTWKTITNDGDINTSPLASASLPIPEDDEFTEENFVFLSSAYAAGVAQMAALAGLNVADIETMLVADDKGNSFVMLPKSGINPAIIELCDWAGKLAVDQCSDPAVLGQIQRTGVPPHFAGYGPAAPEMNDKATLRFNPFSDADPFDAEDEEFEAANSDLCTAFREQLPAVEKRTLSFIVQRSQLGHAALMS